MSDLQTTKKESINSYINALTSSYDMVLNRVMSTINNEIAQNLDDLICENSLTKKYENIYTSYKDLMGYYAKAINEYNEVKSQISNVKVKSVLDGIYIVIGSQLKNFVESLKNGNESPIMVEQSNILEESFKVLYKEFGEIFTEYYDALINNNIINISEKLRKKVFMFQGELKELIINDIFDTLEDEFMGKCHDLFVRVVSDLDKNTNNIENRDEVKYYKSLMIKEEEILNPIFTIQAKELDKEISENNCNHREIKLINDVLGILNDGYNLYNLNLERVNQLFKEGASKKNEFANYDLFVGKITENVLGSKAVAELDLDKENLILKENYDILNTFFAEIIVSKVDSLIKNYELSCTYEMKKSVVENIFLANEVIYCFNELANFYSDNLPMLKTSNMKEIVKGINETVKIKVDSLNESVDEFNFDCEKSIENFYTVLKDIKIENNKVIFSYLRNFVINKYKIEINDDEQIISDISEYFNEIPVVADFINRLDKEKTTKIGDISRKIYTFIKENLLYEISTFEEIINYSVTKLQDSNDESVSIFVTYAIATSGNIAVALDKHNIKVIEPLPHDLFNGKEHEVLMAEKNDDFVKGQVIKLMNCGYKQGENVILRANVIAAK